MGWPSRSFDTKPQKDLINKRGTCVSWERTATCTCTPPGEAPDPTCAGCHGIGRVVVERKTIRGLVTDATQNYNLMNAGVVQDGDLIFSQYPNDCNQLNDFDRIMLLEAPQGEPFMGERIKRGSGTKDLLTYNANSVQFLTQTDPATGVTTQYTEKTDFNISGRWITWVGPHQPAVGSTYSIQYRVNYEYTVVNPPFIRYEGQTNLGQRVILKLRNIQGEENASAVKTASIESIQDVGTGDGGQIRTENQGSLD